jgi:hypothetical protein
MSRFKITNLLLKNIFLASCVCYIISISISTIAFYDAQVKIEKTTLTEIPKTVSEEIKNNIDKAKGDMIGVIAIPIIATISSIFVAFVVKDAVTEFFRREDREAFKREVKASIEVSEKNTFETINSMIIPELLESAHLKNLEDCNRIEAYATWIEYNLFRLSIHQAFDDISQPGIKIPKNLEEEIVDNIKLLLEKYDSKIMTISSYYNADMKEFRKLENRLLISKASQLNILPHFRKDVILNLERRFKLIENGVTSAEFKSENPSIKIENSLLVEYRLLTHKIGTIPGNEKLIDATIKALHEDGEIRYNQIMDEYRKASESSASPIPDLYS